MIYNPLGHVLELSLSFLRRSKRGDFISSNGSITTPNGYTTYQRRVDANASLEDGIERARERQYVGGRKCKRLDE